MNELLAILMMSLATVAGVITIGGIINPRRLGPEKIERNNDGLTRVINYDMTCPNCTRRGQVRIKSLMLKKGISGAKVTGALFTAGVSLLATGISRKEQETHAHCGDCNSVWYI